MGPAELPLALALVAGAVAAVNPCGFALLPAYLTLLLARSSDGGTPGVRGQVVRAVRFSLAMTAGFVAVFGAFGAVIAQLSLSIERYLPVVTVAIGVVLLA
ncbi:MAG: cytochrome c biogenesis protein CcdA, partial [Acidothermales bacterium]|nr:cytochrome c biogenesis protein CcdA [Acidothermales bacterium]